VLFVVGQEAFLSINQVLVPANQRPETVKMVDFCQAGVLLDQKALAQLGLYLAVKLELGAAAEVL
jgi:hypothetical protein